jgi:outer membrane protein assembly factor BamD
MMKKITHFVILLAVGLLLNSCGPKKVSLDPKTKSDSQLYQIGVNALKNKDYQKARDAFRVVFDNFPKSDYRILAKLAYADAYYQEGGISNFILAAQEYQDFISLFPFSPKACYAQLQTGMCYFQQFEKPDRDQTNTKKALDEFRKVVDNYPNCEQYKQAQEYVIKSYSHLAEHEYIIAHFYQRTGKHQAAVDRLKGILKDYPESVYQPKMYYALARSLEHIRQNSESCTYYQTLVQKWPKSEFSADAKAASARVCKSS